MTDPARPPKPEGNAPDPAAPPAGQTRPAGPGAATSAKDGQNSATGPAGPAIPHSFSMSGTARAQIGHITPVQIAQGTPQTGRAPGGDPALDGTAPAGTAHEEKRAVPAGGEDRAARGARAKGAGADAPAGLLPSPDGEGPGPTSDAQIFSPTPFAIAGYILLIVVFGGLGGWAATAPLASAVVASGTVSVESNRKIIQHFEGGIVEEILVRDGDEVRQGDVLLRLTATQANASNAMLQSRYHVSSTAQARLQAERIGKTRFDFPQELASSDDPRIAQLLQNQLELFNDRHAVIESQIDILRSRIDQYQKSIVGLEIQKDAAEARLSSAEEEVERLREGEGTGAVATNRLTSMEREAAELRGIVGRHVADIASVRGQIGQTEQEIIGVNQTFRERAAEELKIVQDELNELEERLIVSRDVLARTEIQAPRDGIVQNLRTHTIGGVVQPGEPIMEIVPLGDELIVNAQVRPLDVDSLSADLQAEVRFPAFVSRNLPLILGHVEFISPDIISPDDIRLEPYYLARIIVEEENIPEQIRGRLVPGMPSDVIIATAERTVLNYLITPLSDAITKSLREE